MKVGIGNKFLIFDIDVMIVDEDNKEYEFRNKEERIIFNDKQLAMVLFSSGRFTFVFRKNHATPDIIAHECYHAFFMGLLDVGEVTPSSLSDEIYAMMFEDLYTKVFDMVQKKLK